MKGGWRETAGERGRGSEQKGEGERNREREIDFASYSWSPGTGLLQVRLDQEDSSNVIRT